MVNVKHDESVLKAWVKLHKRYLPPILIIAGVEFLISIIIHSVLFDQPLLEFQLVEWVVVTDLIMLPLAAVNGIFFVQQFLKRFHYTGWKMVLIKVFATIFSVMIVSYCLENIYSYYGFEDDDHIVLGENKLSPLMTNVVSNTFVALAIGLPIFIWQSRVDQLSVKLKEKEVEQERLKRLKTQAELHALQSRINPHFLFNSFNSIASLISIDPVKAETMMVQLSELFRYSLNSQESNFVPIKEELKIVKTYLEIEKIRFGENLDYQINSDPELSEQLIPRFLVQPLVENAIKHAISKIKQGELLLELKKEQASISLSLYDNGPSFPHSIVKGYGLKSTYDKLQLLYPERHSIELVNQPEKYIRIILYNESNESKA